MSVAASPGSPNPSMLIRRRVHSYMMQEADEVNVGSPRSVASSRASLPRLGRIRSERGIGDKGLRSSRKTVSGIFKRADREIAALNFLTSIPMQNEAAIIQQAMQAVAPSMSSFEANKSVVDDEEMVDFLDSPSPSGASAAAAANGGAGHHRGYTYCSVEEDPTRISGPGRRLDGPSPHVVNIPLLFRHRYEYGAAVVRQWEGSIGQAGITEGRLFFSCNRAYPMAVGSIIRYKPGVEEDKRLKAKQADERGAEAFERPVRDWRGIRYCNLLHAEWAPCCSERDAKEGGHVSDLSPPYDPCFLDDPHMMQGKNRQVTVGDSTVGPVIFSVILFINPKQLKDDLNKQFRDKHPELPPSLTLSKIRGLKRQALNGCRALDIEIGTVALACVYFEKLCLKKLVTKSNRYLAFGCCLTLAYKFHEKGTQSNNKLPLLLQWIDREWYISSKQIFEAEFGVYYHLDFALHCQLYEVSHHFSRLLKLIEMSSKDYLGDEMFHAHTLACLPREKKEGGGHDDDDDDDDDRSVSSSGLDHYASDTAQSTNIAEGGKGGGAGAGAGATPEGMPNMMDKFDRSGSAQDTRKRSKPTNAFGGGGGKRNSAGDVLEEGGKGGSGGGLSSKQKAVGPTEEGLFLKQKMRRQHKKDEAGSSINRSSKQKQEGGKDEEEKKKQEEGEQGIGSGEGGGSNAELPVTTTKERVHRASWHMSWRALRPGRGSTTTAGAAAAGGGVGEHGSSEMGPRRESVDLPGI